MLNKIIENVILKTNKRPFEIHADFKLTTNFKEGYDFPELYYVGKSFFILTNNIDRPIFVQGGFAKKYIGVNREKGILSIIDISNKVLLFENVLKFEQRELSELIAKLVSMDFFKVSLIAKNYGHIILTYFNYELHNDNYDKLGQEFSKVKIPAELRKPNGKFLYRGLTLSQSVTDKIKNGGKFSLKERQYSSWSFDKHHSQGFIKGQGILLKEEASKMNIVLNSALPDIRRGINLLNPGKNEQEAIVKGNGVLPKISIHTGQIDAVIYNNVASKINIMNQKFNQ